MRLFLGHRARRGYKGLDPNELGDFGSDGADDGYMGLGGGYPMPICGLCLVRTQSNQLADTYWGSKQQMIALN
jgi:hypothetical protein